ncbi:MAG TPA: type II toxin-antitoxin system RelE/ParE family toxin [Sphingomicrobium sp.]|nr:type II toxin-antitoxin system RelE/ParE family toxin [Sphingomicrobium sp.]
MARLRLTAPAETDIAGLLDWSQERFGAMARRRYEALLEAALRDLAEDPLRAGSREERTLGAGTRVYHLRHSRERARAIERTVQSPRHILVYRIASVQLVVILRVLHDSMDFVRHVPEDDGDG